MRIAHVSPEFYPAIGGVGQVVRELARRQVLQGHEVHVFAPAWDKKARIPAGSEILDGIHVHRLRYWFKVANFSTFWPSLFSRLLKGNFDLIHSHLFAHPHFVLSALVARIKKIPHIHTTHCPWSDAPRSLIGNLGVLVSYNIFSRICLKLTTKIITITPWENSFLCKYGAHMSKIINLPNGMDKSFFKNLKNNDFKKKLGIENQLVLFFGRLNFTKSPDNFVRIAHLVLKERPNTTFVIRGPDEGLRGKVKELIGKEKRIILLPETRDRAEIIKMYQAADLYVLPSYREGLPLTLFEAMASGLPILATPVNGVPYEMKDGENGFLIKHGNLKEFKKKIIELLDNTILRNKLSKNNLSKSREYDWDIISDKTLEVYKIALL